MDIERLAVAAVEESISRTDVLSPFVNSGDKEPSWDGNIYVYSDSKKNKEGIKKIPVQIKGNSRKTLSVKKPPKYSASVIDLDNWLNHGGIVLFVVLLDEYGNNAIYYSALLPVLINCLKKNSHGKKKISIPLRKFPEDNNKKVAIMLDFYTNMLKQSSFSNAHLQSMDELIKGGLLKNITFSVTAYGKPSEIRDFDSWLFQHDLYMYANVKGSPIPIPLPEVPTEIHVARDYNYDVKVKNKIYYRFYNIIRHAEGMDIHIGKSTVLKIFDDAKRAELSFRAGGTLSDCIYDTGFIIDVMENLELTMNGATIRFSDNGKNDVKQYRENLCYYQDVKRMLESFGCNKELICDNLSERDQDNIHNFIKAMLYGANIHFPGANKEIIYGRFVIANLVLLIWAEKINEKEYKLTSFFDDHKLAVFEDHDHKRSPHAITHYVMLRKSEFLDASNIDYSKIISDLKRNEVCPIVTEQLTFLLLEMLKAYDEQEEKDNDLIHAAECYCKWLIDNAEEPNNNMLLNQLQIVRRIRLYNTLEIEELEKLCKSDKELAVRCGANILLGNDVEAQECFDKMSLEEQAFFIEYPICNMGNITYIARP